MSPSALVSPLTVLLVEESGPFALAPALGVAGEPVAPVPVAGLVAPAPAPAGGTERAPPTPPTMAPTPGLTALAADPTPLIAPPMGPPMIEPRLLLEPGP